MSALNLKRIVNAGVYSFYGLKRAFTSESACQQELILLFILTPIVFLLDISGVERIMLLSSLILVIIVEILNTAIETVVNLVSPDKHPLAGYAKDLGSGAVFLSLLLVGITWIGILGNRYLF